MSDDKKAREYHQVITPLGVILLSAIDREDQKYGGYKVWLGLDEEGVKELREECLSFFRQHPKLAGQKRIPLKFLEHSWHGEDEDGNADQWAGMKVLKTSKTSFAPAVFDADGEPIYHPGRGDAAEGKVGTQRDIPRIARGTTAHVLLSLGVAEERDAEGSPNGVYKPVARLKGVQIVDLVEWVPSGGGVQFGKAGGSFRRGAAEADGPEDAAATMPAATRRPQAVASDDPTSF